jgi:hypothetical protein
MVLELQLAGATLEERDDERFRFDGRDPAADARRRTRDRGAPELEELRNRVDKLDVKDRP